MKKYLFTIIISILIGFFLSNYMIKQYDIETNIIPTFSLSKNVYLLQQGVYSSVESMKENTKNVPHYIYTKKDNYYYAYIAISLDLDNIEKIQKYYKNQGIDTIVKNMSVNNKEFLDTLKQCDDLLKQTDDKDTIKEIIKQALKSYEGS